MFGDDMVLSTKALLLAVIAACSLSVIIGQRPVEGFTSQTEINSIARKAVDSVTRDPALRQAAARSVERVTLSKPRLINRNGKVAKSDKDGIRKKYLIGPYVAKYQAQAKFVMPAVRAKGEVDDIVETRFFYISGEGKSVEKAKRHADALLQKTRAAIQEQARASGLMTQ